jgi:hypothetical protein
MVGCALLGVALSNCNARPCDTISLAQVVFLIEHTKYPLGSRRVWSWETKESRSGSQLRAPLKEYPTLIALPPLTSLVREISDALSFIGMILSCNPLAFAFVATSSIIRAETSVAMIRDTQSETFMASAPVPQPISRRVS